MDWTPEYDDVYFFPSFYNRTLYSSCTWQNDIIDVMTKRNVGVYRTEEEAIAKAKEFGWT